MGSLALEITEHTSQNKYLRSSSLFSLNPIHDTMNAFVLTFNTVAYKSNATLASVRGRHGVASLLS